MKHDPDYAAGFQSLFTVRLVLGDSEVIIIIIIATFTSEHEHSEGCTVQNLLQDHLPFRPVGYAPWFRDLSVLSTTQAFRQDASKRGIREQ